MLKWIHEGYAQWRNFQSIIEKAKESVLYAGENVADHFADAGKMVKVGSGAERQVDDVMLTRLMPMPRHTIPVNLFFLTSF